tara:strand:+ start:388 stop:630 length:243 start_codon:yes stop_codon:yes gene_type:complete
MSDPTIERSLLELEELFAEHLKTEQSILYIKDKLKSQNVVNDLRIIQTKSRETLLEAIDSLADAFALQIQTEDSLKLHKF